MTALPKILKRYPYAAFLLAYVIWVCFISVENIAGAS